MPSTPPATVLSILRKATPTVKGRWDIAAGPELVEGRSAQWEVNGGNRLSQRTVESEVNGGNGLTQRRKGAKNDGNGLSQRTQSRRERMIAIAECGVRTCPPQSRPPASAGREDEGGFPTSTPQAECAGPGRDARR